MQPLDVPVQSLEVLAAHLRRNDEWDDERTVVDAVCAELHAGHPAFLTEATGEWKQQFLILEFRHGDGTVLKVTHGDGYTAVTAGSVNYRDYLDTSSLIDVLIGALHGRMTYVQHSRFGYKVGEYFEVVGRDRQRLGYSRRGLVQVPFLRFFLRSIPMIPESVARVRINFDDTPAITDT